jgi:hypothetical protein
MIPITVPSLPQEIYTLFAEAAIDGPLVASPELCEKMIGGEICEKARLVSVFVQICIRFHNEYHPVMKALKTAHLYARILNEINRDIPSHPEHREQVRKMFGIFGGICKYPILDIGQQRGWTDFIDFIGLETFKRKAHPIQVGCDYQGRVFFSLFVIFKDAATALKLQNEKGCVITVFQRMRNSTVLAYGTRESVSFTVSGTIEERVQQLMAGTHPTLKLGDVTTL